MVEIIPAILPKSLADLKAHLERIQGIAPLVQIDLVESNILAELEKTPLREELVFECDIMLQDPALEVGVCVDAGASRVVVHAAAKNAREALEEFQHLRAGEFPVMAGVALRSHDTPEVLKNFEGLYDYVQVMGIDRIGRQGEPPDPHHQEIKLVAQLRKKFPDLVIQVDGGAAAHVRELALAGANRLVVGSAIVQAENPQEVYKTLYSKANGLVA